MNRSLTFRSITLNVDGLFVGRAGIHLPGLILILVGAVIATTDHRWWVPLAVLAFVPLVILYGWSWRRLGFEPVSERFRPVGTSDELERLRADNTRYNELIVDLQHMIDAAGGVPTDIRLLQRVECLIKQRDGQIAARSNSGVFQREPESYG